MFDGNSHFIDILNKGECSEAEYRMFKELFDVAVNTGLINGVQKLPKKKISTNNSLVEETYFYRWKNAD